MMAQNQRLLDSTDDKWCPSRQHWDTISNPDEVERLFSKRSSFTQWYFRAKRRIEPWGFTIAIVGALALSGSLVVALRSSFGKPTCPAQGHFTPKPNVNPGEALYNNRYPIQHDYIGAYITCPLDSPAAAREAGCTFDSLFHGYIPDPCLDHDLYQYWVVDRLNDLQWRVSDEDSPIVPTSDILQGDISKYPTAWAPTKTHYNHCLYLINGTSRAQAREAPLVLDTHLDESHMQHCFEILTHPPENYPATFMFVYQHRCYIRSLSRINDQSGAFIRKLKKEAEDLLTG
ncbi:hypothetical protein LZ32DRAFT_622192 [Colletotrichum eremochloae]|nr:hypothetical protein LZ32DRAFT_622192 [Colletotrichum eremochloae]